MVHEFECRIVNKKYGIKIKDAEMMMLKGMCGVIYDVVMAKPKKQINFVKGLF